MKTHLLIIIVLCFCTSGKGQLSLTVTGTQPYPVIATNYLDEIDIITATVRNQNNEEINFKAHVSIVGPYDLQIMSEDPSCSIEMNPNETKRFGSHNFDELCLNFNEFNINNIIQSSSLSDQQKEALIVYRILPEGSYSYCITLKDAITNVDIVTTCLEINITHPDRPVVITPNHESTIDANKSMQFNITWSHIINDVQIRLGTTYNVKIVSLGNNQSGDYQFPSVDQATIVLDDPSVSPIFEEQNLPFNPKLSIVFLNDYPFLNENYYALRITAVNEEYPFLPESSQSNVHIFMYKESDESCGDSFEALPVFPKENEYIPFTKFANIVKMEPYCDTYDKLQFSSIVKNAVTNQQISNYNRTLTWRQGPKEYFERTTNPTILDPDEYYSSFISFGDYQNLTEFERGKKYIWFANGKMYMDNHVMSFDNYGVSYNIGMPPISLELPISGDTISPGNITFNAMHTLIPENPLPPFKVMQIIDEEQHNYENMYVKEVGVLQVSNTADFSNVLHAAALPISIADADVEGVNRLYNHAEFINNVYRSFDSDGQFSEFGKYFLRIGWMKSPVLELTTNEAFNVVSDMLYNVSVDSFIVGIKSNTNVSDENGNNNNTSCYSSCQLPNIVNTNNLTQSISDGFIKIGKFKMEITDIDKIGDTYNGTGTIKIPFLFEAVLEVTFNNIKINTDTAVYEGSIVGKQGGNELESLNSLITGQEVELPFGLVTKVKSVNLTLAFTDFTFAPTHAFAEINFDTRDLLSLIQPSDLYPILSTQICLSPMGYENDLIFHSINDLIYQPNEAGYGFEIRGGQNLADTASMTYFRFDCDGFHSMQLAGAVVLSQDIFLKDSGNVLDDSPRNESVKGEFKAKFIKDEKELMITAKMEDFQFANYLEGWGFDVDTFYLDFSDLQNPPNFIAPEGYSASFFSNPATANTWKGIYIPKVKVLTPEEFVNTTRSTMGVTSMILGDGIYYLRHRVFNIVNEGILGRMQATVDTIDAVISNIDFRFKLTGKLLLPFVKEGDYLSYSGMYNELNDWNFIINVGTDSLEVDLWKAYMRLYENSYFLLSRDETHFNRFYIKTLVNGHISLDDNLMPPGGIGGFKNFKLPRIEFENLGYESGLGFIGGAVFRKASPQKSINGFPIQLDSISMTTFHGNPGLYIEPSIVLTGEENGFSGSVGLIFYGSFSASSPLDVFSDINVFLSEINIDVAVASCTFKGYIKFIDDETEKGFEGILDATFPTGIAGKFKAKFGNVKHAGAQWNTAGYYTYWYVDALIAFGETGIPVFAGVNLYGIGGGLWYNMAQDTTYKIKPSELYKANPTPSNTANNSPIPYTKKFGSGYGIRIQGLFGDAEGGDKLNMLLALSAQFPVSGGPIIKLRGDVNILSEISALQDDGTVLNTKKSLWGFAEIEYNGQDDFIHAEFNMKAKITVNGTVIVRGLADDYSVVDAEFHANTVGNTNWYLFVGTQEDRGGIQVKFGPKRLEANSYFMMGHGVPNSIPDPDPRFLAMLDNQSSDYTSSQGSINAVLNKPINMAYGVAFGGAIFYIDSFKYQPFYLNVNLIVGADINFTKDDDRVCLEDGENPGHNGWYGSGQLYVGLSGEFGIHIDLWFIECDKTLFNGSVATVMSGGLPNPSWFYCRGTLRYDIAGLVRGSHSFEMQAGNKCTIGNGNPFGDMDIITDTNPKQDENKVSIFTEPTVSYAFPLDEVLSFYDDKKGQYVYYKIYIDKFTLTRSDFNYNPSTVFIDDNFVSTHKPNQYLKGKSDHNMKVLLKAKEKLGEHPWHTLRNDNGSTWTEDRNIEFKTDIAPDTLTPQQIELTYPLQGQQYFMKEETEADKGFVYLTNAFPEMFYRNKDGDPKNYKYVVEFKAVVGGTSIVENVEILAHRNVRFKVNQLVNNKKYIAYLKREIETSYQPNLPDMNFSVNEGNGISSYKRYHDGKYEYEILPAKMVKLGKSIQSADKEKTLFKFIFKTSNYNNLSEKLNALNWAEPVNTAANVQNIKHIITGHIEDFDEYDLEGYDSYTMGDLKKVPLIDADVHYLKDEAFEGVDFEFLGNDLIIKETEENYFFACKSYVSWKQSLSNPLRTTVNNLINNARSFNYVLGLNNLVKLNYNAVKDKLQLPVPSSNGLGFVVGNSAMVSSGPNSPPPPKTLTIRVNYHTAGLVRTFENQCAMADHLQAVGDIVASNNISLYRSMNRFVNAPLNFYVSPCKNTKIGLVYRIPKPGEYTIKTQFTKNYKTPGSCELPDVD